MLEEASVRQRAGESRFASLVQLLELPNGERLVRVAYTTDGAVRRGPVTLRPRHVAKLRDQLEGQPLLKQLLHELL